jgi:hypothetical protein
MPALTQRGVATIALLTMLCVGATAQTLNPSARDVVKLSRPLTTAEMQMVLEVSRAALDGVIVHIAYQPDGPGPDLLMRSDGQPRYMRATSGPPLHTTFTHYTGQIARGCDGNPAGGELVLEYEDKDNAWTVKARTRSSSEVLGPIIELFAGGRALTDGGQRRIGDRETRGFVTLYKLPEGATGGPPDGTTETIFIDIETLRPVRWIITPPEEMRRELPPGFEYGVTLTYPTGITLQPPEGVAAPDCIR